MASTPLPLALQTYSIRDVETPDFAEQIERIAASGYSGVELYMDHPHPHRDAAAVYRANGLEVIASHILLPLEVHEKRIMEMVDIYGLKRLIAAWIDPATFTDTEAVKRHCESLNDINNRLRARGLELGYHNHWEFKRIDDTTVPQLLLEHLDPTVFIEVDPYWATVGGLDPVVVTSQVAERLPILQIKDGPATDRKADMTAAGDGAIDVPGVVNAAGPKTEWLVMEFDRCAGDMLEAVEKSARYLISEGLATDPPGTP